jgi:hypothetical protein
MTHEDMREDFFIDGSIKHMFHVMSLENDPSTYFYYPGEATIKRIFKYHDIEPARRIAAKIDDRYEVVLSRYHHWGLTVWINPYKYALDNDSRPVVDFGMVSHTPYLIIRNPECRGHRIEKKKQMKWGQKIEWKMAKMFFRPKRHQQSKDPQKYPLISKLENPRNTKLVWKFDNESILTDSAEVLLIGLDSDIECIFRILCGKGKHISESSLKDFLKNVK